MMTQPEPDHVRFALALITAWGEEEVDAFAGLTGDFDNLDECVRVICGLSQVAHQFAEEAAFWVRQAAILAGEPEPSVTASDVIKDIAASIAAESAAREDIG